MDQEGQQLIDSTLIYSFTYTFQHHLFKFNCKTNLLLEEELGKQLKSNSYRTYFKGDKP